MNSECSVKNWSKDECLEQTTEDIGLLFNPDVGLTISATGTWLMGTKNPWNEYPPIE